MRTIEMQKVIKSRCRDSEIKISNFSKIRNITWGYTSGLRGDADDDAVKFTYEGKRLMLVSRYTAKYSAEQLHELCVL